MRVEQNANIVDIVNQSIGPESKESAKFAEYILGNENTIYSADKTDKVENGKAFQVKEATYLKPESEEKKTAADAVENNASLDAAERKNQMIVLSNTTSEEDYAKLQEEGFSLEDISSATIITVTDKIKAQLAKAGVDISVFGDDLTQEQLEAIAGNPELALQIAQALKQADLPCTQDNVKDALEAAEQATALEMPSDSAIKYLLDNDMQPTIENIYKAEHSGNYGTDSTYSIDVTPFIEQVEKVIRQAGLEVNEQTVAESQWMLEHDIPLNEENLKYVDALRSMTLPQDAQTLIDSITTAIAEGSRPKDALMIPEYSLKSQAREALAVIQSATDKDAAYVIDNGMDLTVRNLACAIAAREADNTVSEDGTGDTEMPDAVDFELNESEDTGVQYTRQELARITARRQLEEIRLAMTVEANYALLKRGIQIDTQPLVQLVEELKQTENTYYENLLRSQGVETTEENVSLFRETIEKVSELKSAPAYVLGMREIQTATVEEVYGEAKALRDTFVRANESYETLMTAPRADLGDSIQKAFQNVDEILKDIGLETTEANRRAVRILGYNEIAITEESVAQIKAVDEEVQRVFRNMTPATVLKMIREGVNPLDMNFSTLNAAAEQIASEDESANTGKFSEFLWKLEQNNAVTEEERASYIGIYRLIHQVEQSDGAVIGALVNQGAEITMRNLMMAVRTERHTGKIDYTVDNDFGERGESGYTESSIIDQIETAYQNNCIKDVADILTPNKIRQLMQQNPAWENMTPEQLKAALQQAETNDTELDYAYAKEQLNMLSQSAGMTADIYAALERYDIPNTMINIMAMESMLTNRNGLFRQIFGSGGKNADEKVGEEDTESMKQEVLETFEEAIFTPEEMTEAQERLEMLAENVMRDMLASDEVTSLDVREMRLMSAQLSINHTLAKEERYSVPVMVSDGVVNVSLKIVRGADKKGVVDITMESALRGKISATFQAKERGMTALIAADNTETKALLEANGNVFVEEFASEENTDIHYAYISDLKFDTFSAGSAAAEADTRAETTGQREGYQVQTTRLYHIAEAFIRQIRELL